MANTNRKHFIKEVHLTPEDLANRWNVPLATLSQWRWNGLGPPYLRLGKHIAYRLREIEAFEEKHLQRNTACSMQEFLLQEQYYQEEQQTRKENLKQRRAS